MKTTLTISDQVYEEVRALARRERLSFRATVEMLLIRGLGQQSGAPAAERFVVEPHRCGLQPGVDPLRFNQALDDHGSATGEPDRPR